MFQLTANGCKLAAGFVLDATEFVQYLFDATGDGMKREDTFGKFLKGRKTASFQTFLRGGGLSAAHLLSLREGLGKGALPYDFHPSMKCS